MSRPEALVEGLVVIGATIGIARILLTRPVRRELRTRPGLAVVVAAIALAGLAGATWLAFRFPIVRRLAIGAVAAGIAWCSLRARPGFGRRRGLPPGSLGLLTSLDAIDDPDFYVRASGRWGPVFKMSQVHRPVVCITDLELGLRLFREREEALRQSDWAFNRLVPGGYVEYTDGAHHQELRARLVPGFTEAAARAASPVIAAEARARLADMARASDPDGVHPEPYLLPISHAGLIRMVLGVPPGHPDFETLRRRFVDLNRPLDLFLPIPRASRHAYEALCETVARLARAAGGEAAGPRITAPSVLHALATANPAIAEDPTAIGNLVLMVKEGGIMARGMLRWVIKMLADHPEEAARLRAAAADTVELDARAAAFALETIRRFESPYLYRRVADEVEVAGYRVPRGWLVRLCLAEAHARPDAFPDPGRFDPDRFHDGSGPDFRFCPFGSDSRACPGRDIALEIAKGTIREAALGYELRVLGDGPPWRINRHWGLWRPSPRLRVRLEPRPIASPRPPPSPGASVPSGPSSSPGARSE